MHIHLTTTLDFKKKNPELKVIVFIDRDHTSVGAKKICVHQQGNQRMCWPLLYIVSFDQTQFTNSA